MPGDSRFKNNPFEALRGRAPASAPPPRTTPAPGQSALPRLIAREEFDEEEAAVVTRLIGVPPDRLRAVGAAIREATGASVLIEGRELLVVGASIESAASCLRDVTASEVVVIKRPSAPALENAGVAGGTERVRIRRGLRVAIVQKADQQSGKLTEGLVRDILTSSPQHPRGIKVRLESGEVGRVRRIL